MEQPGRCGSFPAGGCGEGRCLQPSDEALDKAFEYDNRVQLPGDFDKYFSGFQRHSGQTLLDYCTLHDELYNRLADHKVTLPNQVQGWHLLRRAGLTREQRGCGWTLKGGHRGKGRGYAAFYGDDEADPGRWDESYDYDAEDYSAHYEYDEYYTEHNDSPTHYESPSHHGYFEEDTTGFGDVAAYYGDEAPPEDPQSKLRSTTVPLQPILMLASASTTSSWHVAICPSSPSAKLLLHFPLAFRHQPHLRLHLSRQRERQTKREEQGQGWSHDREVPTTRSWKS